LKRSTVPGKSKIAGPSLALLQPHSPEPFRRVDLDRDRHDRLLVRLTPTDTGFLAADIRLVHFHGAAEAISAGPDHGAPHLVQPDPRGLVAAESDGSLKTESVPAELLAGHVPRRLEPGAKRLPRALENRPRRDRRLAMTGGAVHLLPLRKPRSTPPHPGQTKPVGQRSRSR
jgi:hypothetical protein